MAEAPYLKDFSFDCAWDTNAKILGATKGLEYGDAQFALMTRVQGFDPLAALISARLRKEKRVISPTLTRARCRIVAIPITAPYIVANPDKSRFPTLCCDHMWDLDDLLEFPTDQTTMGEKAVEIVEEFLSMTKSYQKNFLTDFPYDLFEEAIRDFRTMNYTVSWHSDPATIEGSALKSVFKTECSGEKTIISLEVRKRGKTLYCAPVHEYRGGLAIMGQHNWVTVEEDGLRMMNFDTGNPGHFIPFDALPDEVVAHLPKVSE